MGWGGKITFSRRIFASKEIESAADSGAGGPGGQEREEKHGSRAASTNEKALKEGRRGSGDAGRGGLGREKRIEVVPRKRGKAEGGLARCVDTKPNNTKMSRGGV